MCVYDCEVGLQLCFHDARHSIFSRKLFYFVAFSPFLTIFLLIKGLIIAIKRTINLIIKHIPFIKNLFKFNCCQSEFCPFLQRQQSIQKAINSVYSIQIMISQYFERCVTELRASEFKSIYFLKAATALAQLESARVQSLLIYSFYALSQERLSLALKCIEQGIETNPNQLIVSMFVGMKGAILTHMQKYSLAIQCLKDSMQTASKATQQYTNYIRNFFPFCMSRVIYFCNFNHGRRQFSTLLQKIRVESSKYQKLYLVRQASQRKIFQIRELMRLKGKTGIQSKNGLDLSMQKSTELTSNIYISRLYTQRKQNLAQRDNSTRNNWSTDPYNLIVQKGSAQYHQCVFM